MALRSNSIDSGLLSSETKNREDDETFVKPVFNHPNITQSESNSSNNRQNIKHFPSATTHKPKTPDTKRRSHQNPIQNVPKQDSDSDQGIVSDVTKLLVGRQKRGGKPASSPTYSIHINSLYVYQQPAIPVDNPLYHHLPVDRPEETPPSPCPPNKGYQFAWSQGKDEPKEPEQHTDNYLPNNYLQRPTRPTSIPLHTQINDDQSNSSDYSTQNTINPYATVAKRKQKDQQHFCLPSEDLSKADEIEICIRDKEGKSRRYKLQPIEEDKDDCIISTQGRDTVIAHGITINDRQQTTDGAEEDSCPETWSIDTPDDDHGSDTAINTVFDNCKVTVNKTYQPNSLEDKDNIDIERVKPPDRHSLSTDDLPSTGEFRIEHARSVVSTSHIGQNFNQAKHMNDPSYFDFSSTRKAEQHSSGFHSKSVPNLSMSSPVDVCYRCRNQKKSLFSKQKIPDECTLEGFYSITDDNEVAFRKDILEQEGKLGSWFVAPQLNQPGYKYCLYVKTKHEVSLFPVLINRKRKLYLDTSSKKSFQCLCKLTKHYKSSFLPFCNINLGHPLPNDVIPDVNSGADGSSVLKEQYVGIKL